MAPLVHALKRLLTLGLVGLFLASVVLPQLAAGSAAARLGSESPSTLDRAADEAAPEPLRSRTGLGALAAAPPAQADPAFSLRLEGPVTPRISLPLRQLSGHTVTPTVTPGLPAPDPESALRRAAAMHTIPTVTSFEGISAARLFGDTSSGAIPPDPSGAAGWSHYVEWVNGMIAVYDKATGRPAVRPIAGNELWRGTPGPTPTGTSSADRICETQNRGDPVVHYDRVADRWLLSQFNFPESKSAGPFYQCIAISRSPDPTGEYYLYSFKLSDTTFPDYPHFGVWPDSRYDAYYALVIQFEAGRNVGPGVIAFERARMLRGEPARFIYGDSCPSRQNCTDLGYLPSDLDGTTPPPPGSPNYFVALDDNQKQLELWEFRASFAASPVEMSFTRRSELTAPNNYSAPCPASNPTPPPAPLASPTPGATSVADGAHCVPQPGTAQRLDVLADRLMYRLAYRNFGTHEAMVVNHTVAAPTSTPAASPTPGPTLTPLPGTTPTVTPTAYAAVRWYELRRSAANDCLTPVPTATPSGLPGPTWCVGQAGDYAPDASYRWMGSTAMDRQGNIAIAYSHSSAASPPSIRYAGRQPGDPRNTLPRGEYVLQPGGGVQEGSNVPSDQDSDVFRWGDYSELTIDPNDCTFWYVQEYYARSSERGWHTRVGAFQFPSCTPLPTPTLAGGTATPTTPRTATATATRTPTPTALLASPGQATPGGLATPTPFLTPAPGPALRAYVANGDDDTVSAIDTRTNAVVVTVPVGAGPRGLALNPAQPRLYVANVQDNTVTVVDTTTNAVLATIGVGEGPSQIAVNPTGTRGFVTNVISGDVSILDTSANRLLGTVRVGVGSSGVAVHPAGTRLYVTNALDDSVSVVDLATTQVVATVRVGQAPSAVAVAPDGTRAYIAETDRRNGVSRPAVSILDTASNRLLTTVVVGDESTDANSLRYYQEGIAVSPNGRRVYRPDAAADVLRVLDTASNTLIASVPVGETPLGVAVAPDGSRIYVSSLEDDVVSALDAASHTLLADVLVGSGPRGVAVGNPAVGAAPTPTITPVVATPTGSPTSTPSPTTPTSTPLPATATPTSTPAVVPPGQNPPPPSGQAGVPCTTQRGGTCTVSGGVTGVFTLIGSMSYTLSATGPAGTAGGGTPAVFIPTTVGVESFACGPVGPTLQTTCVGITVGNVLQGAAITVRFPLVGGGTADVTGIATGPGPAPTTAGPPPGAGVLPGIAPAAQPLLPPAPPIALPPPPPPALAPLGPPAAPAASPAAVAPEVPIIPEGNTAALLLAGLLGAAALAARRRLRDGGPPAGP